MNFLADQDVYAATVRFLQGLGHDVVSAAQLGMSQAEDADLLRTAQAQGRIFIRKRSLRVDHFSAVSLQHG